MIEIKDISLGVMHQKVDPIINKEIFGYTVDAKITLHCVEDELTFERSVFPVDIRRGSLLVLCPNGHSENITHDKLLFAELWSRKNKPIPDNLTLDEERQLGQLLQSDEFKDFIQKIHKNYYKP